MKRNLRADGAELARAPRGHVTRDLALRNISPVRSSPRDARELLVAIACVEPEPESRRRVGAKRAPRRRPAGLKGPTLFKLFLTLKTSDPFWRWCRKCQAIAFCDGSRDPGPCAAGGTHDHSQSDYYCPPSFDTDYTEALRWDLQPGETFYCGADVVSFEVLAFAASGATIRVTSVPADAGGHGGGAHDGGVEGGVPPSLP